MMHGGEKSDSAIVAMKPANKAVRSAAELVERRAGTEGNAGQQSTLRAQNRAGVTQALERVREAARQRKKERFTTLLHHVSVDTLREAFYALQRNAAPGVDGLTWDAYAAALEPRLEDLHGRVQRGAYRPQPSRRTYIPKADGRLRPLAIGTYPANCTSCQTTFGVGGSGSSLSSFAWAAVRCPEGSNRLGRRDIEPAPSRAWLVRDAARVDRLGPAGHASFCRGTRAAGRCLWLARTR